VRRARAGSLEPIVVHCSAGIGRTGVLILMETAMCLVEQNEPVYTLDITRTMRDQRAMLIQNAVRSPSINQTINRILAEPIRVRLPGDPAGVQRAVREGARRQGHRLAHLSFPPYRNPIRTVSPAAFPQFSVIPEVVARYNLNLHFATTAEMCIPRAPIRWHPNACCVTRRRRLSIYARRYSQRELLKMVYRLARNIFCKILADFYVSPLSPPETLCARMLRIVFGHVRK